MAQQMTPQELVAASVAAAEAAHRAVAARGGPVIPVGPDGKCTVFDVASKEPRRLWPVDALEQARAGFVVFDPGDGPKKTVAELEAKLAEARAIAAATDEKPAPADEKPAPEKGAKG